MQFDCMPGIKIGTMPGSLLNPALYYFKQAVPIKITRNACEQNKCSNETTIVRASCQSATLVLGTIDHQLPVYYCFKMVYAAVVY